MEPRRLGYGRMKESGRKVTSGTAQTEGHTPSSKNTKSKSKDQIKERQTKTSKNMKSFMLKHQAREHGNNNVSYVAKVTERAGDCLTRQVREAVHLRRCTVPTLNS
jgi:hypothetical protein